MWLQQVAGGRGALLRRSREPKKVNPSRALEWGCREKMQGTRELLELAEEYVTGNSICVQIRNKGS